MTDDGPDTLTATPGHRFAAKKAGAKALGTGMQAGVFWRDMGVVNLPGGRPTLVPRGLRARIDLSLTDDEPYAQAFVIISAETPDVAASTTA